MIKAVIFDMYETLITLYDSPVYFSKQMAEDLKMNLEPFKIAWEATENERTLGLVTLEDALTMIMKQNKCYSEQALNVVVSKRVAAKRECFMHLNPEIVPMLMELKNKGIKIGLISNCYSEEAMVIRQSVLFPFFDAIFLSYEQGIQKPDVEIFNRCMNELKVLPEECLYVGDGGSHELETAEFIGMKALQATWYLKEGTKQPVKRKEEFISLNKPMDVIEYLNDDI